MKLHKLYVDLDGVLADFDRAVLELTGSPPQELTPSQMWPQLARAPDFFGQLAFMEDAELLWERCLPHQPTILTGLPRGDWAAAQKRRWVARMLGQDVPIICCMTQDKPRYSGPGHLLIDDRTTIRERWKAAGGHYLRHVSVEETLEQLDAWGI